MIVYKKHLGAFNLLLRLYGAPWPRALLLSFPSTLAAVLICQLAQDSVESLFPSAMAPMAFATLVAFGLVFPTNLSYARYWEGCTQIRIMTTRWADAVIQVISFDEAAEEHDPNVTGGLRFRSEFVHAMSLMHALALLRLRGDRDVTNITSSSFFKVPPAPSPDPAELSEWKELRQKRGIWALRTDEGHFEMYWRCFPLPVIGGLSVGESDILEESTDKVFLVMCWVLRMLGARRHAGGVKNEAPIIARIYQVLSDGMLGYENAYKVTMTPFPFPFAQSLTLLLHLNAIITPLALARWAGPPWLAGLMTFLTVFACYLYNEVASEIEEPFKFDPNDLPLVLYQHKFNEHLVTAFVKSIFPSDEVLFDNIERDDTLKRMVAFHRPTSRNASGVSLEKKCPDVKASVPASVPA